MMQSMLSPGMAALVLIGASSPFPQADRTAANPDPAAGGGEIAAAIWPVCRSC